MLKLSALVVLSGFFGGSCAMAAESPIFGGPVGATDIRNALLPPPGVYLGLTQVPGFSDRLAGNNYNFTPASSSTEVSAAYLLYVYPFSIFGGRLSSGIEAGYADAGHFSAPFVGKAYQHYVGWLPTYADLINYSKYIGPLFGESKPSSNPGDHTPYGLTIKGEYSMLFPDGHYDVNEVTSPGLRTFFFIPNVAVTYYTPPDFFGPIEFDLHAFYDAQSRNPLNDYSSGSVLDVDYAVVQNIGKVVFGFAGAYAIQLQNDTVGPAGHSHRASPNGDRLQLLSLGPIVSFPIAAIHARAKIKAPFAVEGRNTLMVNGVVLNLDFAL